MRRRKALDPGQGLLVVAPVTTASEPVKVALAPAGPRWAFERLDDPKMQWFIDGVSFDEDAVNFYVVRQKDRRVIPKDTWKRIA